MSEDASPRCSDQVLEIDTTQKKLNYFEINQFIYIHSYVKYATQVVENKSIQKWLSVGKFAIFKVFFQCKSEEIDQWKIRWFQAPHLYQNFYSKEEICCINHITQTRRNVYFLRLSWNFRYYSTCTYYLDTRHSKVRYRYDITLSKQETGIIDCHSDIVTVV